MKEKSEKEEIIYLEEFAQWYPEQAKAIQDIIRENSILRYKLSKLMEENRRLINKNISLQYMISVKDAELETLRNEISQLSNRVIDLQKQLINLRQQVELNRMRKGMAEMTLLETFRALERLNEKMNEIFSSPAFELGMEKYREIMESVKRDLMELVKKAKETKTILIPEVEKTEK